MTDSIGIKARSLGEMVPLGKRLPEMPARYCTFCKCKLSRYNCTTICAPCSERKTGYEIVADLKDPPVKVSRNRIVKNATHCIRGHELTPETIGYQSCDGHRYCMVCRRESSKRQYARRKGAA